MSGVFGALFSGQAAQGTDESLRRWRQLFKVEEQMDLQREQMQQEVRLQQEQRDFSERLARIQADAAQGRLDDQQAFTAGQEFLTILKSGNYNIAEVEAQLPQMAQIAPDLAPAMRLHLNQGLYSNPQQALAVVDTFTNDLTNRPSWESLEAAYTSVWQASGTPRDEIEDRLKAVRSEWETRGTQLTEEREAELDAKLLIDDTARANLRSEEVRADLIEAQTVHVGEQTAALINQRELDEELRPFIVQQAEEQANLLSQQAIRAEIENGVLPDQLAENLNLTQARVREMDNADELFRATFNDTVTRVAKQAEIATEEARHIVATGMARDAIVNANAEQAKLGIDLLEAQIETEGINQDLGRAQVQEAKLSLYNNLMESQNADLYATLAPDLLADMNISEEDRAEIIELGREIVEQDRVTTSDLENAQARVAIAQADFAERSLEPRVREANANADYAEWKSRVAEDQRLFENRIKEAQSIAYTASIRQQAGMSEGGLMSSTDAIAELDDNNVGNVTGLFNEVQEWNNLAGELQWLKNLQAGGVSTAEVQALADKGISPQAVAAYRETLEARVGAERSVLTSRLAAYATQYRGLTGSILPPDLIGLDTEHPLYVEAVLSRDPSVRQIVEEDQNNQAVRDDVESAIQTVALESDPMGLTGSAQAIYDSAVEEHGEEALAAIGIEGPQDIAADFAAKREEVSINRSAAQEGMIWASQFSTLPLEFSVPADRLEAAQIIDNRVDGVMELAQNFERLANPPARANLGVGNPGFVFDPSDAGRLLLRRTDIDPALLQQAGIIDTFGNVIDIGAASTFLYSFADQLAEQSLGIKYFIGK